MKMKKIFSLMGIAAIAAVALQSCSSDEPFAADGEGLLRMKMVINSNVTRADLDQQELADKCVIYLSDTKGLLYKYQGLGNVPSDLYLKSGNYVAEAWTGDSVSASWDKKFYRAYEPFTIQRGDVKNVVLNCRIANVVASVNPEPIIEQVLKDYTITVGHSRGSLVFDQENMLTAHAYFMMPSTDKDLTWKIEGKDESGAAFTKEGVISNVQRAHEYVLDIKYTQGGNEEIGGGFITVTVDDQENIIEDTVEITAPPAITGMGFDIAEGINGRAGSFSRRSLYVQSLGELSGIEMNFSDYAAFGLPTPGFDLYKADETSKQRLREAGIDWEMNYNKDENYSTARVSMSAEMLNRLPNGEYTINVKATDSYGKSRVLDLAVNVSDEKILVVETPANEVKSYSTMLYATVTDETLTNIRFRYRPVGTSDWCVVAAEMTRSYGVYAHINSLHPATRYEYQVMADGYVNPTVMTFTTDAVYSLPNAGFEDWYTDGKALVPGTDASSLFWGTGNGATAGMAGNITTNATDIKHSGQYAARLQSTLINAVIVKKFAAGNLFAGIFGSIDMGNMSANLTFGRSYNGAKPVKMRGWANYRPGTVDQSNGKMIQNGAQDQGHIYVALTTQTYDINPGAGKLFDKDSSTVIAYGELIFDGNYGPDGDMQEFEITLNYRDAAAASRAGYILVVATSSRYGDYFEGSTQSVLYLDDLELVYE